MYKFYVDLKEFILGEDSETRNHLIPYYETLLQLENYSEMNELLTTYETGTYIIDYTEPDKENYFSMGQLDIYEAHSHKPVSFKIELEIGNLQGNYCQCKPTDQGYIAEKKCCGISCDAYTPSVIVTKELNVINHEFQGYQRDLWELEEKWYTDYVKESQHKKQLEHIKLLEYQIDFYQKELELAKEQLK